MDEATAAGGRLQRLTAGMPIPYGGDRVTLVPEELAAAFSPGDRLVVVQDTGDLLHVPAEVHAIATEAVDRAVRAFDLLGSLPDAAITAFYEAFAKRLEDDAAFAPIAEANAADVARARERGRSTTRLELTDRMRADMVTGLRAWRDADGGRGAVVETVAGPGWELDAVRAGLGVIAFVFEGRPNVFADATGVLRSGNTVVFRIGSDALGTAEAIVEHALDPALADAGLPEGAVALVASPSRAAGHALFADPRLGLAVARGSGPAVAQLGAVARQAGNPVSLHGTGGAWIVADATADPVRLQAVVRNSLDRKVCNTLNTLCIVRDAADALVPVALEAMDEAAAERGTNAKLHATGAADGFVPDDWRAEVPIRRSEGDVVERKAEPIGDDRLGVEWEWEESPEVTLHVVEDVAEAVAAFNAQAPRFVASLLSRDADAHAAFFDAVDAPFVGDGFTRWVDGQYALSKPELGLSNWEFGRLFGRGGILSGDSAFTIRYRLRQHDDEVRR